MTLTRQSILLSAGCVLAIALVVALPHTGGHLASSLAVLSGASRPWLAVGALGFLGAFVATVGAWRAALRSAGADICARQAAARLGVGAMVNSVAPAKLGDAVKIALCSRAIATPDGVWTAGGAYAALAVVRSLSLAALMIAAAATRALPLWPVLALLAAAGGVLLAVATSSRIRNGHRIRSLVAAFSSVARSPRRFAYVAAWTVAMQLARLAGTAAVAIAFGLPSPLLAALVILPALDLAGAMPLTPGSIGIGSGAVSVALASRGIGMTQALAVGLAIQAVETIVSATCGSLGIAYLVRPGERFRRYAPRVAVVGTSVALATGLGVVYLADLL